MTATASAQEGKIAAVIGGGGGAEYSGKDEEIQNEQKENGDANDEGLRNEVRPSKRRKVSEGPAASSSSTGTKIKPESPPWKKIAADGPSSFTENGIRKSGRVNSIPLQLQPHSEKRTTRGTQKPNSNGTFTTGAVSKSSTMSTPMKQASAMQWNPMKRTPLTSKDSSLQPSLSPKRKHRKKSPIPTPSLDQDPTPKRSHKKKVPVLGVEPPPPQQMTSQPRRRARQSYDDSTPSNALSPINAESKVKRIKFIVKPPLSSIPLVHPDGVPLRPRKYPTFQEYLEKSINVPIEDGGLLAPEDAPVYTEEMAEKEAKLIIRMEEAVENGGVLSEEKLGATDIAKQDRVPPQYWHRDHFNAQAISFFKLMRIEHTSHRKLAKRTAELALEEWTRRQPKSEEQIEREARQAAIARYQFVLKTLKAKWELVKAEVNRRRLAQWEAEEQARVRKALNEAVDISTQKLEARRIRMDSEMPSDEDEEEGEGDPQDGDEDEEVDEDEGDQDDGQDDPVSGNLSADDSDRESNMSSDSEAEDDNQARHLADDEHLSVEELRRKYADLPETVKQDAKDDESSVVGALGDSKSEADDAATDNNTDDSDESIDMDDDMGSSDEGSFSGENDGEDDSEDELNDADEAGGGSSLLGFLVPSERVSIAVPKHDAENDLLDEGEDGNEVSLNPELTEPKPPEPFLDPIHVQKDDQTPENDRPSAYPSSQPTPRTAETKPSEIDSASSIEIHDSSRLPTQSSTPQPAPELKTPIPSLLRGTLRDYQHYGLDWLAGLYANNTNGILADEMGLGKTIQTISLLAHLACYHEIWGQHLVVVPTSVLGNWEVEFRRFCPGFKVLGYYGSIEERKRKRLGWKDEDAWNVVVTSYEMVIADVQVFKRRRWHYMILDEAHNIKNFRSKRWQTLLTFNTRARLLLTGTPLQNNLTELWSLLFFLMPSDGTEQGIGGFADLKEFSDWFRKPQDQILEHGQETIDDESMAIIGKLHKVLRPYLLRRLKADVEKEMPGKYEHVEYCRLSKRQRQLYDGFLSLSGTRETLAGGNYMSIVNCLMQLKKVCNHPDLFETRQIMTSFAMDKSAVADYEVKELLVRKRLLHEEPMHKVSLEFLNFIPVKYESLSSTTVERTEMLSAHRMLAELRDAQRIRGRNATGNIDLSTVKSNLTYLESASRWSRFEELRHCVYLNALRRQTRPIYGKKLVEMLTLDFDGLSKQQRPTRRDELIDWHQTSSEVLRAMKLTLEQRSDALKPTIQKFGCVTPAVIAPEMHVLTLTRRGAAAIRDVQGDFKSDPFHEARMKLSIQFPDKRLLQYDCGKLQALDKLLRRLQAGGHRALIFTQMTKVLDVLEQFLNIHGHKYLRLDGSTKTEQRTILTERFNKDTRILAFILSSRSGGVGLNMTGADTVIFYDLDWNPAMDKQCQDRAHRIGQTRDVHIYRLISEHTIEANILRKANQKRLLDDVVIQQGDFTTEHFNKPSERRELLEVDEPLREADAAAEAAVDRVLGGRAGDKNIVKVLEKAEDAEDVAAARVAQREEREVDAADFEDRPAVSKAGTPRTGVDSPAEELCHSSGAASLHKTDTGVERSTTLGVAESGLTAPVDQLLIDEEEEINAWGEPVSSVDSFLLKTMAMMLEGTPLELPKDKSKRKRGKDKRSHRAR